MVGHFAFMMFNIMVNAYVCKSAIWQLIGSTQWADRSEGKHGLVCKSNGQQGQRAKDAQRFCYLCDVKFHGFFVF